MQIIKSTWKMSWHAPLSQTYRSLVISYTTSLTVGCFAHDRFYTPGSRLAPCFRALTRRKGGVYTVRPQFCNLKWYSRLISLRLVSGFGPRIAQLFIPNTFCFCFFERVPLHCADKSTADCHWRWNLSLLYFFSFSSIRRRLVQVHISTITASETYRWNQLDQRQ